MKLPEGSCRIPASDTTSHYQLSISSSHSRFQGSTSMAIHRGPQTDGNAVSFSAVLIRLSFSFCLETIDSRILQVKFEGCKRRVACLNLCFNLLEWPHVHYFLRNYILQFHTIKINCFDHLNYMMDIYILHTYTHVQNRIYSLIALYGYESIPINTISRGMNIHLPAIFMFTRGTRF